MPGGAPAAAGSRGRSWGCGGAALEQGYPGGRSPGEGPHGSGALLWPDLSPIAHALQPQGKGVELGGKE